MTKQDTDDEEDESSDNKETEINASLSSLDVTVRTEGKNECEDLFYNVWDYVMDDAEDMSSAMEDRLSEP